MRRDCQYWTDGRRYVRIWCNATYGPEHEKWEAAKKEVLHHTDGWVPSATVHLSILYDGDWERCGPLERPQPDWWNRHRDDRSRRNELQRTRRTQERVE